MLARGTGLPTPRRPWSLNCKLSHPSTREKEVRGMAMCDVAPLRLIAHKLKPPTYPSSVGAGIDKRSSTTERGIACNP